MRSVLLVLCLGVVSVVSGCASITSGKVQPVSVISTCDGEAVTGAQCTMTNDKGSWFVKTPGSVSINKAYGDMAIECKKGDKTKGVATFKSASEGAVWGNVLAGGIIGYAVDAGTGAGFSYPPTMTINMSGDCKAAKAD
jgi:hypothetical protein